MVEFGDLYLDATNIGSPLRYAAHRCADNNTRPELWTVAGEPRLVLVATKDIPQGSELSWNYVSADRTADSEPVDPKALWFHCQCK
eukprot:1663445-Rhodomonas_salina.2